MNDRTTTQIDQLDTLNENLEQALAIIFLIGEQFEGGSTKFNDHINRNANWAVQRCLERAIEALGGEVK